MKRPRRKARAARRPIRRAVPREGAQANLLLMLLSFAGSVFLTRAFLTLTGYPRLGGGQLHIAHVLWGGLLLFAASLLPLIWANRWVYRAGALLSGAGVGLFIDEVGKFITASNDYFFPAAAPIVYAFFLLAVLVYLQVARRRTADARSELYAALDGLEELLDQDLGRAERTSLRRRLRRAQAKSAEPELSRLARALREFVRRSPARGTPEGRGVGNRLRLRLLDWERRILTRPRHQAVLAGGMIGLALLMFKNPGETFWGERFPGLAGAFTGRRVAGEAAPLLFALRVSLEVAIGAMLTLAAGLLALRRERVGLTLGLLALLISLTVLNIIVMYFEQFSTMVTAAVQLLMLLGIFRFRARFLS